MRHGKGSVARCCHAPRHSTRGCLHRSIQTCHHYRHRLPALSYLVIYCLFTRMLGNFWAMRCLELEVRAAQWPLLPVHDEHGGAAVCASLSTFDYQRSSSTVSPAYSIPRGPHTTTWRGQESVRRNFPISVPCTSRTFRVSRAMLAEWIPLSQVSTPSQNIFVEAISPKLSSALATLH